MTPLPRGTCPVCGSWVALRKGGLVREHRARGSLVDNTKICTGSGQPAKDST